MVSRAVRHISGILGRSSKWKMDIPIARRLPIGSGS
jgi:hypothetical protein